MSEGSKRNGVVEQHGGLAPSGRWTRPARGRLTGMRHLRTPDDAADYSDSSVCGRHRAGFDIRLRALSDAGDPLDPVPAFDAGRPSLSARCPVLPVTRQA